MKSQAHFIIFFLGTSAGDAGVSFGHDFFFVDGEGIVVAPNPNPSSLFSSATVYKDIDNNFGRVFHFVVGVETTSLKSKPDEFIAREQKEFMLCDLSKRRAGDGAISLKMMSHERGN